MPFTQMKTEGAWVFESTIHGDSRGDFREVFRASDVERELGHPFRVKQANLSSSHAGVLRGVHFTQNPPHQAKYVSCVGGRILDFVVDLRTDSGTFGEWDCVELDARNGKSVLISGGIGHAFLALENDSLVHYMCSEEYNPDNEQSISPLGSGLSIPFSDYFQDEIILSDRDRLAPSFDAYFKSV